MKLFGWEKYFANMEIYPGRKVTHFDQHNKKLRIPLDRMLFFDDETRNIQDLEKHGMFIDASRWSERASKPIFSLPFKVLSAY